MAFEWLRPILTPNALATVQANPILLAYLLAWFGAILFVISVALAIHFQTNKVYKKPKKAADKKGGPPAKSGGLKGVVGGVRTKLRI
jgi:hypothetical protein